VVEYNDVSKRESVEVECMRQEEITSIDLHMHTTVSDGTDTPEEIIGRVKSAGIGIFSVTDHDAVLGSRTVLDLLGDEDPFFVTGVEFSAKDEKGKYHILGYHYDPGAPAILAAVHKAHELRMRKVHARLDFLKERFGIAFPEEDLSKLLALNNPGKPHIANLMVEHGFAKDRGSAIRDFIDQKRFTTEYLTPEEVIRAVLDGGGIPVLAHPVYGSGDDLILGEDLEERFKHLMQYGLAGAEAFYSGFTDKLRQQVLALAEKYGLYVTAGSDYHGTNKLVRLGETNYTGKRGTVPGLERFLERVLDDREREK